MKAARLLLLPGMHCGVHETTLDMYSTASTARNRLRLQERARSGGAHVKTRILRCGASLSSLRYTGSSLEKRSDLQARHRQVKAACTSLRNAWSINLRPMRSFIGCVKTFVSSMCSVSAGGSPAFWRLLRQSLTLKVSFHEAHLLYSTCRLQSVQRHGSMPLTLACIAVWTCAKGSRVALSA